MRLRHDAKVLSLTALKYPLTSPCRQSPQAMNAFWLLRLMNDVSSPPSSIVGSGPGDTAVLMRSGALNVAPESREVAA